MNKKKYRCVVWTAFWIGFGMSSCNSDSPSVDQTLDDDQDVAKETEDNTTVIVLDKSHNYQFRSEVDIMEFRLQEYPSIPVIDWSGLSEDILGHEVDPEKDVGHVELIVWKLSDNETFEGWLNTDALDMTALVAPVNVEPSDLAEGITRVALDELVSFGNEDVHPETYFQVEGDFPADEHIFVLVIGRGKTIGEDAIVAAFLKPVADAEAPTEVKIDQSAVSMSFEAALNENGYTVPANTADIVVDWREMIGEDNAIGQPFTPKNAARVMLTFYRGRTLSTLQDDFLGLEIIADEKYVTDPVDMTPLSLEELKNENGEVFSGIGEEQGTWLLSLWCTSCNNPAPKYMTMLVADTGE